MNRSPNCELHEYLLSDGKCTCESNDLLIIKVESTPEFTEIARCKNLRITELENKLSSKMEFNNSESERLFAAESIIRDLQNKIVDLNKKINSNRGEDEWLDCNTTNERLWKGKYKIWFCTLCDCWSITCPDCDHGSCSGGGCDKCKEDSREFSHAKTSVTDYLTLEEQVIYEKSLFLKKYIGESLYRGFSEINWKVLQEEGELCGFAENIFDKEIKESLNGIDAI